MKNSVLILAGGFSRRFGQDKGLIDLAGKPLILHVVDRISQIDNEPLVVVNSSVQKQKFESLLSHKAKVIVDKHNVQSPLVGASSGFESAKGKYSLLLPCDAPLISIQIAQFLLNKCLNKGAVIPRWPNKYIEPLQAAYNSKLALAAAKKALEEGKLDLRSMIARLDGVQYIATVVLRQMDPNLLSFFNINTARDLKRAESLLK